jgi:hypothetical protein
MANGDPVRVGQEMAGKKTTKLRGSLGPFDGDCILSVGDSKDEVDGSVDGLHGHGAQSHTSFAGGAGLVGTGAEDGGTGVVGLGGTATGIGVFGLGGDFPTLEVGGALRPTGPGVVGYTRTLESDLEFGSPGVCGVADSNDGVVGIATVPATSGVRGFNGTKDAGGAGVFGHTPQSSQGFGVVGDGNPGGVGVLGQGQIGVFGMGPFAGVFKGDVSVTGDFSCLGTKSAAVPYGDGTLRRLYSVESPESWFEDFGEGALKRGKVRIKIAADFRRCIGRGTFHVFLTPLDDCNGLFVRRRSAGEFDVQELGGGTSSVKFSYRIVAKRKGTENKRLEKLPLPDIPSIISSKALASVTRQDKQLRSLVAALATGYLKRVGRGGTRRPGGKKGPPGGARRPGRPS